MIVKYNFVIPFYLPWGWSADYQRQTCLELAKMHKVIAFMKKDRKFILKALFSKSGESYPQIKNLKFYIPYDLVPFQRFEIVRNINDYLAFKLMELFFLDSKKKYLWIFDPIFFPLTKIFRGKTIYDCVDFLFVKEKKLLNTLKLYEKLLIKKADYFFVNSNILRRKHLSTRVPTSVVPQGFSLNEFKLATRKPPEFPHNKPLIGFVGAVNQRINFDLLTKLIVKNPQWNFAIWGPRQDNSDAERLLTEKRLAKIEGYKNYIAGESTRSELPGIIRQFDVAMIPYDSSQDFNRFCYPMKLFEYFYIGKPVVSTHIEELKRFPKFVKIGKSASEFQNHIKYWLNNPLSVSSQAAVKKLAIDNSWSKKIAAILKKIGWI